MWLRATTTYDVGDEGHVAQQRLWLCRGVRQVVPVDLAKLVRHDEVCSSAAECNRRRALGRLAETPAARSPSLGVSAQADHDRPAVRGRPHAQRRHRRPVARAPHAQCLVVGRRGGVRAVAADRAREDALRRAVLDREGRVRRTARDGARHQRRCPEHASAARRERASERASGERAVSERSWCDGMRRQWPDRVSMTSRLLPKTAMTAPRGSACKRVYGARSIAAPCECADEECEARQRQAQGPSEAPED